MGWERKHLDMILVPSGLVLMFGYHIFLLYRIIKLPQTTVIGYENHNKRAWVERMMQVDQRDKGLALTVISSNISAATFLASMSITLSSLIGAWIGSSSNNTLLTVMVYGDTSSSTTSIKYISLLSCFLVAFASFIQSARYFVHGNFLISTPNSDIDVKYVEMAVIRGGHFWSIGLRALYFATVLLLWIFGPIPMFVSSVIMVSLLYFLDKNLCPLHDYQPPKQSLEKGVGGQITTVTMAIENHSG